MNNPFILAGIFIIILMIIHRILIEFFISLLVRSPEFVLTLMREMEPDRKDSFSFIVKISIIYADFIILGIAILTAIISLL